MAIGSIVCDTYNDPVRMLSPVKVANLPIHASLIKIRVSSTSLALSMASVALEFLLWDMSSLLLLQLCSNRWLSEFHGAYYMP